MDIKTASECLAGETKIIKREKISLLVSVESLYKPGDIKGINV